jgi:hypothetical protein
MKVYTLNEVERGVFHCENRAEELRERVMQVLPIGEKMLLADLIKVLAGKFDINAYASVRNCFTPRNGFRVSKQGRRLYVERENPT